MNRILRINNLSDAVMELKKINVSSGGIEVMALKAIELAIKLNDVKLGAANILKQEMLSLGGDAAVARGVVEGKIETSEVILLGNFSKIKKLIKKLDYQPIFGLKIIKKDLEHLLSQQINLNPQNLNLNNKELVLDKVRIMGILNVTPDSFSDGKDYANVEIAFKRAQKLIKDGADIIDIGGESTRPGAVKVSVDEELKRVIPVIEKIREYSDIPISIDTTKAEVAGNAIKKGADMLNDISALKFDEKMINILLDNENIPVVLMHMQGNPESMQQDPHYSDVIDEILDFLKKRIEFCVNSGISRERILIDPGIGFGKRQQDNLEILRKLSEFKCLGRPIVLGASRKSFIDGIYRSQALDRLEGSLATSARAFDQGVEIIRVHDVLEHKRFLETLQAIG